MSVFLLLMYLSSYTQSRNWEKQLFISKTTIKSYSRCSPHKSMEIPLVSLLDIYSDGSIVMSTDEGSRKEYNLSLDLMNQSKYFSYSVFGHKSNYLKIIGNFTLTGNPMHNFQVKYSFGVNEETENSIFDSCEVTKDKIKFIFLYDDEKNQLELSFYDKQDIILEKITYKMGVGMKDFK